MTAKVNKNLVRTHVDSGRRSCGGAHSSGRGSGSGGSRYHTGGRSLTTGPSASGGNGLWKAGLLVGVVATAASCDSVGLGAEYGRGKYTQHQIAGDVPDAGLVPDDGPVVPDDGPIVPDEGPIVPDEGPEVTDTSDVPDTPDIPDEGPDVPDEGPDIPDEGPDTSDTPDTPDTPVIPDEGPDVPDEGPDVPDEGPDIPDTPDTPVTPDTPDDGPDVPICEPDGPEICDGKDNDCNGEIDETFPTKGEACEEGTGLCKHIGELICEDGEIKCSVEAGDPVGMKELLCDDIDDDCDGATDEDFPLGEPCKEGTGVCAVVGVKVCDSAGGVTCSEKAPVPVSPNELKCDNKDDDCDGATDEDFPAKGQPCTVGEGVCANPGGVTVCATDGVGTDCEGDPNPQEELVEATCDDKDNDCDGIKDNIPKLGEVCESTQICENDGVLMCDPINAGIAPFCAADPCELSCDVGEQVITINKNTATDLFFEGAGEMLHCTGSNGTELSFTLDPTEDEAQLVMLPAQTASGAEIFTCQISGYGQVDPLTCGGQVSITVTNQPPVILDHLSPKKVGFQATDTHIEIQVEDPDNDSLSCTYTAETLDGTPATTTGDQEAIVSSTGVGPIHTAKFTNLKQKTLYQWTATCDDGDVGGTVSSASPVVFKTTGDGLVGWWDFNPLNPGGLFVDSSGLNNHGVPSGNPFLQQGPGIIGGAMQFVGPQDAVLIHDPVSLDQPQSIAIRFRPAAAQVASFSVLLDKHNSQPGSPKSYTLAYHNGNKAMHWGTGVDSAFLPGVLTPESWVHMVLVHEAGAQTLFLNGVAVGTGSIGGDPLTNSFTLAIGANISLAPGEALEVFGGFTGMIDDVEIYNVKLTPEQVSDLHQASLVNVAP